MLEHQSFDQLTKKDRYAVSELMRRYLRVIAAGGHRAATINEYRPVRCQKVMEHRVR